MEGWKDDLRDMITTSGSAESILQSIRNELQIDAQEVFENIDHMQIGYITSRTLVTWLKEHLGWNIEQ